MATYTDDQLARYFQRIAFSKSPEEFREWARREPLAALRQLQQAHMASVPFESLSLHYSKHRMLSLDPEDLFEKVVVRKRGGYCMEVNNFLAAVMRSLGYTLLSVGGRVSMGMDYTGWSHMVNLVKIDGTRHLVDVGFGSHCVTEPTPLVDGTEFTIVDSIRGKLEYRSISAHSDPDQRLWVFSSREAERDPWRENYAFPELEFFPVDFEVMNMRTSSSPTSIFVKCVIAERILAGRREDGTVVPEGLCILFNKYVKEMKNGEYKVLETLETEEQRVAALEKYFGISLTPGEQRAIKGLASEL